ncbi:hypothetical protein CC86DRAFT_448407 [Ophiobolus disseminans]|uniref:Uncharacterized protein n=1 Tax=Ophiobolus disseminans TaxID=1469910 RepID=A0A6A6ZLE6_9PLEO|nr:hypothetical protein CC86DRAFT_448407 [Ophiobolus disseminans]
MAKPQESDVFLEGNASGHVDPADAKHEHDQENFAPPATVQDSIHSRRDVISIGLTIVSAYSTLMSGVFFVVAIVQPRYGFVISSRGPLSPVSAILLTTFLAKTIELSFVMVFLAFLCQVLSRRALQRKGVTLSSVAMRSWILVRFAGGSFLGLLCLSAAILSLLYTTAAGVLVQPQMRYPSSRKQNVIGEVRGLLGDPLDLIDSCLEEWPTYLSAWGRVRNSTGLEVKSFDIGQRPKISAVLNSSITVLASWLDNRNVRSKSDNLGRIINNVTVTIPHRGIPMSSRNSRNHILQPEDLSNAGSYSITAGVVMLVLSVLCVNANRSELELIVYQTWPNALNTSSEEWSKLANTQVFAINNLAELDTTFQRQDVVDVEPIFLRYPETVLTVVFANNTEVIITNVLGYLLGRTLETGPGSVEGYLLCSHQSGRTASCSTRYDVSSSGQSLEALCDTNAMRNAQSHAPIPDFVLGLHSSGDDIPEPSSKIRHLLGDGEIGMDASVPSPAEILLSIFTCAILDLAPDFPFVPMPNPPGRVSRWAFHIVLLSVFLINIFILIYLGVMLRVRLITDLCEPLVLFLLGYHSPPDNLFRGLPHDGVNKTDFLAPWCVNRQLGQLVVVGENDSIATGDDEGTRFGLRLRRRPWRSETRAGRSSSQ